MPSSPPQIQTYSKIYTAVTDVQLSERDNVEQGLGGTTAVDYLTAVTVALF